MNAVIERIYAQGWIADVDGRPHPRSGASIQYESGAMLYHLVRTQGCTRTLEVGLAHGLSALFICQAHAERGEGLHIAIDPFQQSSYHRLGLRHLEQAGLDTRLVLHEAPSFEVLPRLLESGERLHFALIDGKHTFDYTLLDFFYIDRMLEPGGYVAFDDLWLPAVRKAVSYVLRNRSYTLWPAPADVQDPWPRRLGRIARRFAQTPFTRDVAVKCVPTNTCVLQKQADDTRPWNDHHAF